MLLQHLSNTLQLWTYYSLLACGFYFASVSCRHFNFTTGFAYLLGPYVVLVFLLHGMWSVGIAVSLISCAGLGLLYHYLAAWLFRRGSREGQLLIISLAIMAIGENGIALAFGSTSKSLWPFKPEDILISRYSINVTIQEFVSLIVSSGAILLILLLWRRSTLGIALRGLIDSRLNLMLRGYNVQALEGIVAAIGFLLAGLAGILWSIDLRVRPSMSMEASLIGVVTFIVGPMLADGIWGLVLASLTIAVLKLPVSLFLEGDWSMTMPLIIFFMALLFYRGKVILRVRAY